MKSIIYLLVVVLAVATGLLFFVQSEWAKDKICLVLQETALQQGIRLKIEKIEGSLPLKWTLSKVYIGINDTDSLDIDRLQLRIALFPLLRKHLAISYLSADQAIYRFIPRETTPPALDLSSFSIRLLKLKEIEAIDLSTGEKASYSLEGGCRFVKRSFALHAKIASADLDLKMTLQGNKKRDQISTDLNLHVKSARAFAPFKILPVETAFKLEMVGKAPWKGWSQNIRPIMGEIKLEVDKLAIPQLRGLDEKLFLTAQFSLFPNRSLDISSLTFKSDLLCIKGNGVLDEKFFPTRIEGSFLVPHLSRLSPAIEGIVKGDILYDKENCYLIAKSDRIDIRQTSFNDIVFKIEESQITLAASHPNLSFKAKAHFTLASNEIFVKDISFQGAETVIAGDFTFLPPTHEIRGGAAFQINDLSPYSALFPYEIAGQLGGSFDFQGENIYCRGIGKSLQAGSFLSQRVEFNIFATDIFNAIKGKIDIETQQAVLEDLFLESCYGSMGWDVADWSYSFNAVGEWKKPFDITSRGRFSEDFSQLTCDTLMGQLLEKNICLQQPFTLTAKKLSDFHMKIEDGVVLASFDYNPENAKVKIEAEHFPLDFLTLASPRFSLHGLSSINVDFQASQDTLEGHCNLLLEQANIFPAGSATPIQTKGSLQINIDHGVAQLHSHLVATGEQFLELSATIPLSFNLTPLHFTPHQTVAGQCTIEGHIEQLFDFINIGTQRFGGFLSCNLLLSGTLDQPSLFGPISLQGGFYQNYFVGMGIRDLNADAAAQGNTIVATHVQAHDEAKGTSISNAIVHLAPNLPFSVEGTIDHFRVIQFDWLTAECSGPFKITGDLEKGLVQGTLNVDVAVIHIPEQLPADLPVLPITFINQPESYAHPLPTEHYPFHYDLHVHAKDNIRLSGRGLEAELAGDLHITGKNLTVSAVGALQTKKGQFTFAGKDFNITQGELTFSESQTFLNITSTLDLPDMTATVVFRGALTSPELVFQSNPPLPTGSLLARILFNKDVSELSATQALQLADTILTLSGGAGPNVMETIRKNLGIDRLSISASEETGKIALQVGKKIAKGVMITLLQSTESSQVIVEVELKGGFVLSAETQEDDQGKFTFKWNKNY